MLHLKSGPGAGYAGTSSRLSLGAVCAFRPNHLSLARRRPTPAAACPGLTSPHPQEFIHQSPQAEVRLWLSRVLGTKIIQVTQPNVLTGWSRGCGLVWVWLEVRGLSWLDSRCQDPPALSSLALRSYACTTIPRFLLHGLGMELLSPRLQDKHFTDDRYLETHCPLFYIKAFQLLI